MKNKGLSTNLSPCYIKECMICGFKEDRASSFCNAMHRERYQAILPPWSDCDGSSLMLSITDGTLLLPMAIRVLEYRYPTHQKGSIIRSEGSASILMLSPLSNRTIRSTIFRNSLTLPGQVYSLKIFSTPGSILYTDLPNSWL